MNKYTLLFALAIIAISLGCSEKRTVNELWYKQGAAEAASDISKSKIFIYGYGYRDHRNNISSESGFILKSVGGCIVDDKIEGHAAGYNDAIQKWLKNGGKPINTYADTKQFVCGDPDQIIKAWDDSPYAEISAKYRDDDADLEIEVRKKKLERITVKDIYVDVIEIRNDGRLREENPVGTTNIRNLKIKRNASVPYLLYCDAEYVFDDMVSRGVMIYDYREMMILRYFPR